MDNSPLLLQSFQTSSIIMLTISLLKVQMGVERVPSSESCEAYGLLSVEDLLNHSIRLILDLAFSTCLNDRIHAWEP